MITQHYMLGSRDIAINRHNYINICVVVFHNKYLYDKLTNHDILYINWNQAQYFNENHMMSLIQYDVGTRAIIIALFCYYLCI
jgi:hypothetical protein